MKEELKINWQLSDFHLISVLSTNYLKLNIKVVSVE